MVWSLQQDPRVDIHDRTNVRHATADELGAPFGLIVADLSFISICTVADALVSFSEPDSDFVLLIKPQFELGKREVGKGGIGNVVTCPAEKFRLVEPAIEYLVPGFRIGEARPFLGAGAYEEL